MLNHKVRISPIWQDILLIVSQKLQCQKDITSVLRVLQNTCLPVVTFDELRLSVFDFLHSDSQIYILSVDEKKTVSISTSMIHELNRENLNNSLNASSLDDELSENEFNTTDEGACRFTLKTPYQTVGSVEFIRTPDHLFAADELSFLSSLADILAGALEHLAEVDGLRKSKEDLLQENNHLRILVDVTNTAISTLNMETMLKDIAKDIYRFFGIRCVGLALYEPEEVKQTIRLYNVLVDNDVPIFKQKIVKNINEEGALLKRGFEVKRPMILNGNSFKKAASIIDPVLPAHSHDVFHSACILPLNFGHQVHGAIMMAHEYEAIFSKDNVAVLKQIADRVAIAVHNVLDYEMLNKRKDDLELENVYLSEQVQSIDSFGEIVGCSPAIQKVLQQVESVANSDCTVLVLGETGTGKEVFARAIHNRSLRKNKRMVKMNCASVPSGLLESELFGHEKGSFTGATAQRKGRFEMAHDSTLLLDEVGDIPLELQPKLLRVLQEREIERLGGSSVIPVNVRLIAATNRNLTQMINDNEFRADLYYRLYVFPIILPPLRERREDIPLLAQFFTQKMAKQMQRNITSISTDAMKQLCAHPWYGNVRELANVIERAVILSTGSTLNLQMQELEYQSAEASQLIAPFSGALLKDKEDVFESFPKENKSEDDEREQIIKALKNSNGVVAGPKGAAAKLGVKRTTLLSRMQRLGISAKDVVQNAIE